MSKARNSALVNGLSIGVALGMFGLGWFNRWVAHEIAREYVEEYIPIYPDDPSLLMHIEYLKATGDKLLLICIIIGIVLLALGIGMEAYQRAKEADI